MTDQKAAIITGGSSGIGRAAAVALAKQGVKIYPLLPIIIAEHDSN
jgi:NAD(P)-dependent dehydrogenase (short-subunit alcohol dehydrogenase family)